MTRSWYWSTEKGGCYWGTCGPWKCSGDGIRLWHVYVHTRMTPMAVSMVELLSRVCITAQTWLEEGCYDPCNISKPAVRLERECANMAI